MDVRGALGLSDEVRNGFTRIRVTLHASQGDAPAEKLREVVERAQQRSAVFDMVTQRRAGRRSSADRPRHGRGSSAGRRSS